MKDSYYDGVRDTLDKVFCILIEDFQIDSDTAFEKLEEIEKSILLYPRKIKVSKESLDDFKKHVQEICPFPKEIEEEFESLYGYGNAPKEISEKNWLELMEFYVNEGLY